MTAAYKKHTRYGICIIMKHTNAISTFKVIFLNLNLFDMHKN